MAEKSSIKAVITESSGDNYQTKTIRHPFLLCHSGLPEVWGDLLVKAAAEGLPGGGDPEAE